MNALVIVFAILCFTVAFFFLYKYRCTRILYGWLGLSVCSLLGFSGGALSYTLLLKSFNSGIPWLPAIDMYSFVFIQFNFAVMGVAVVRTPSILRAVKQAAAGERRAPVQVFWRSPLLAKQVYLVMASCIMAWYACPLRARARPRMRSPSRPE